MGGGSPGMGARRQSCDEFLQVESAQPAGKFRAAVLAKTPQRSLRRDLERDGFIPKQGIITTSLTSCNCILGT